MLVSLLLIGIAFIWLLIETDWLTIRLEYGKPSLIVARNGIAVISNDILSLTLKDLVESDVDGNDYAGYNLIAEKELC